MKTSQLLWWGMVIAIFLPRLIIADDFFIQDEQPWIDRSQTYVNALFSGDFTGAVQYPLSNHPAITLMTTIGPVMNFYGQYHGLNGTYASWSLDDKRESAVWARYAWGIVCSFALLLLYRAVSRLTIFEHKKWLAGLVVVLLGLEPWIWGISRSVSVDVLMAIGVVGMLVSAVVSFEKSNSMKWAFYSGAWFGLAFISKSPALITAPLAIALVGLVPEWNIRASAKRIFMWMVGAYSTAIIVWPPFLLHPIQRLIDVLGRAELHATIQESYYWPGAHPPLFIFTLSAFATLGCLLYVGSRLQDIRTFGWKFIALDIVFVAGIWHGIVLMILHGDHARKNLPVLGLLGFMGAVGWVWILYRRHASKSTVIIGLLILQGVFVLPYFPNVITSYNTLFPSVAGKRLLVDIGNGSRLIAEYINTNDTNDVYALPMDSLIAPYVDGNKRNNLRSMPSGGEVKNLDSSVTKIVVSASLPARVLFDPDAKQLLKELSSIKPDLVLYIRDVPMFYIYTRH